jgi:hypothetical protein
MAAKYNEQGMCQKKARYKLLFYLRISQLGVVEYLKVEQKWTNLDKIGEKTDRSQRDDWSFHNYLQGRMLSHNNL